MKKCSKEDLLSIKIIHSRELNMINTIIYLCANPVIKLT